MIWPAWASKPDSPITVTRQRVPRCYQQRHLHRPQLTAYSTESLRSISLYVLYRHCLPNYVTVCQRTQLDMVYSVSRQQYRCTDRYNDTPLVQEWTMCIWSDVRVTVTLGTKHRIRPQ